MFPCRCLFGFLCRGLLLFSLVSPSMVSADIYEWEWVDPTDHSQGKQQSTTLVPYGEFYSPVPGLDAQHSDFTKAFLADYDLTGANFHSARLTNAYLSGSDLTDTGFWLADLTNADFTGADVRGTFFNDATDYGFTAAQLYSTASYQSGDLTGIQINHTDLTSWNFAGQNLTDADFWNATLTNANFTNAEVRGASFFSTTDSGFTAAQLYSTASYQSGDLTGMYFADNFLMGWDFAGKNLTDVHFYETTLTDADFTGADARTAQYLDTSTAITHNFIHPDGHVEGLNIIASEEMRLWDFDPTRIVPFVNEPVGDIPILVQNALSIDPTGTLRAVFEDDDWGSTLTFDTGIGVSLNGTLELLIDSREGSNVSSMVGATFDLFDWTGVTPSGTFAQITTDAGLVWDLSDLYSTGEVTLSSAPSILFADFDDNGVVDEADLDAWRAAFGSTTDLDADGNGDGVIDAADYTVWRDNFVAASAAVPEPSAMVLFLLGVTSCGWNRRRNTE